MQQYNLRVTQPHHSRVDLNLHCKGRLKGADHVWNISKKNGPTIIKFSRQGSTSYTGYDVHSMISKAACAVSYFYFNTFQSH